MPENEAYEGVVAALRRQFDRTGELLGRMEDGRWWPDDHAGSEDAAKVIFHAHRIGESVRVIARIVATMKD